MVRLKDIDSGTNYQIDIKFQFLMVRLKGHVRLCAMATQTTFQFLMVRLKVPAICLFVWFVRKFQFLMVRLKEQRCYGYNTHDVISIPYGSIKRIHSEFSQLLK